MYFYFSSIRWFIFMKISFRNYIFFRTVFNKRTVLILEHPSKPLLTFHTGTFLLSSVRSLLSALTAQVAFQCEISLLLWTWEFWTLYCSIWKQTKCKSKYFLGAIFFFITVFNERRVLILEHLSKPLLTFHIGTFLLSSVRSLLSALTAQAAFQYEISL